MKQFWFVMGAVFTSLPLLVIVIAVFSIGTALGSGPVGGIGTVFTIGTVVGLGTVFAIGTLYAI
jgi:hypothetical protein